MDEREYERGEGVANEEGTGFEYKMSLLVFLRACRLTKKFKLGVNAVNVGAFDDIVLTYIHKDTTYRLLVQLKHKSSRDFKIQPDALKSEKGPFSLKKYFTSVESNLKENDLSDNTNFVLYTNAALKKPLHAVTGLNPLAKELLSTGGKNDVMCRVKKSDDLCESFRSKGGADKFTSKLVIFCCQASVDELDDLIKQEIMFHFHRIIPSLDTVYDTLLEEMKTWWELTGVVEYLTESWGVWKNLAPGPTLLNNIKFNEEHIAKLQTKLSHLQVHIIYSHADVQIRSLKVLQALQEKENGSFFFIKLDDIVSTENDAIPLQDKTIIKMWQDEKFSLLAVDTYMQSENREEAVNALKMLINLSDEKRHLILISDGNLEMQFGEKWVSKTDICSLDQLDEPSKNLVVERLWEKSPNKTQVLSRDKNGELLSMFLLLENGTSSLLADKNGNTPLQLAVAEQNQDKVELLLELGSDTAAADRFGDTSLIIACRYPSSEIVKLLLDHGAQTTAADFQGDSPLIIAVRNGFVHTVKILLEARASTIAADKSGFTSLLIAAEKGNSSIVDLLLQHGASMTSADLDGNTALHHAVKSKSKESVELLLKKGARTRAADMDGDTPLLVAVKDGSIEIVKLLLQHGALTTAATMDGDTALLIAVKKRFSSIVELLVTSGASTSVADKNGLTPRQIAEKENYREIVRILSS